MPAKQALRLVQWSIAVIYLMKAISTDAIDVVGYLSHYCRDSIIYVDLACI